MRQNGYLPLSRGLLEHLPRMSDNALKVYLYILMTAEQAGKDKGKAFLSMREISNILKKDVHQTHDAVQELRGKYVEFHGGKNQYEMSYFLVKKYKDILDFAVVPQQQQGVVAVVENKSAVVLGGAVVPDHTAQARKVLLFQTTAKSSPESAVALEQRHENEFVDLSRKFNDLSDTEKSGKSENQKMADNASIYNKTIITNKNINTGIKNNNTNTGGDVNFRNRFIKIWCDIYRQKTGSEYLATSKDYVLLSNLIKKFDEDTIVEKAKILLHLCETSGIWFCKNWMADFTIGKLSSHWNSLLKNAGKKTLSERNAEKMASMANDTADQ